MLRISIENEVVPHKELNCDSIASVGVSVFLGLPRVYVCSPIKFVSRSDRRFKTNIFRSIIYIDYHSIKLPVRNRNYDTKLNLIIQSLPTKRVIFLLQPETVPQARIDMTRVLEVAAAEDITGHPYSLAITSPEGVTFVKGTCREETRWWADVLQVYSRNKVCNIKLIRKIYLLLVVLKLTDTGINLVSFNRTERSDSRYCKFIYKKFYWYH